MKIIDLGRLSYEKAYMVQLETHEKRFLDLVPDTLLLVEHEHVITAGKSANEKNLLVTEERLKNLGVDFFRIERGGDYTYHGPGQIVAYPVIRLERGFADLRGFIEKLESVVVKTLLEFSITAQGSRAGKKEIPVGIWVNDEKVAALGIAVKKSVTFHGFALNVNTDLSMFNLIIPCGLSDKKVTSMEKIKGSRISIEDVKQSVIRSFCEVFKIENQI